MADRTNEGHRPGLASIVGGAASYIPVLAGGLVSASLVLSPIALIGTRRSHLRPALLPVVLSGIAGAGFALSAFINDTGVAQRHLAFALLVGAYALVYAALTRSSETGLVKVLIGIGAGWVAAALMTSPFLVEEDAASFWKYEIATPATLLVVATLAFTRLRRIPVGLILIGIGLMSLILNSRSHAVLCVAAAALIIARGRKHFLPNSRLASAVIVALATVPIVFLPTLVEEGYFGTTVQEKTVEQLEGDGPILLAGRTEPPLSLALLAERPVLGWGDLHTVPTEIVDRGLANAEQVGLHDQTALLHIWLRNGELQLHSVTLTSWAEGGILAAVFPIWLLFAGARATWRARGQFAPLITVLALLIGWDALFSPMTLEMVPLWGVAGVIFAIVGTRRSIEPEPGFADSLSGAGTVPTDPRAVRQG